LVANLIDFRVQRIGSPKRNALPLVNRVALPVAGRLTFSLANRHNGVVTVFRRLDSIASGPLDHECLVGRINFVISVTVKVIHANIESSGAELDLYGAIIEV
jgi:hypothetical protein